MFYEPKSMQSLIFMIKDLLLKKTIAFMLNEWLSKKDYTFYGIWISIL